MWSYYSDEGNDAANEIVAYHRLNNKKATTSKLFEYTSKVIGRTPTNNNNNYNNTLDAAVVVTLKYLHNFWKFLDLPLINCEIALDLSWSRDCIISEIPEISQYWNSC